MKKMENEKLGLEAKNRLREFFVEGKWIFSIRTLIWKGQQKSDIMGKRPKMAKIIFNFSCKKMKNIYGLAN